MTTRWYTRNFFVDAILKVRCDLLNPMSALIHVCLHRQGALIIQITSSPYV